jgi:hypothetical protein
VDRAGTLQSIVEAGDYADAQKLIITGNISYEDVNFVDEKMSSVEVLDLSGAMYNTTSLGAPFLQASTKISEISLPSNITTISGDWYSGPFYNCSSLTSITMPESVIELGWNSFYGCNSITHITIPKNVKSIGSEAFRNCSSLVSIVIPEGVTTIPSCAFYDCNALTSISLPQSLSSIESDAFSYCSSLTSITIPEGVTSIEWGTFYDCHALTTVSLPESLTNIDVIAFGGCGALTNLTIPQNVKRIENEAFLNCNSLTNITIPEGVTYIGTWAFNSCSSLTSVTIPKSLTDIGSDAFGGSGSIKLINWKSNCHINDVFGEYTYKRALLLLYTADDGSLPEGYEAFSNISIDDNPIEILDVTNLDANFTPYLTKTAKKIVYTKNFTENWNFNGESWVFNRWFTITLPFKPTEITHETKGILAPFGSDVEGAKNFWLRELTSDGFKNVTEMEANHAYIIAMPTSSDYAEEYRLTGTITFSAENVDLSQMSWEPIVSEGPIYSMYPTYEKVNKARGVYALNVDYWIDGYDYGQVFVHSTIDVNPYEAYVKLNDGGTTMRSLLPVDNKRTAVRGVSSSNKASSRGAYGHRKPQKDDM